MQERLESSDLGRSLISAFLLLTLLVIFTANLPRLYDSELERQLTRVSRPYLRVTGLDQSWSVFAPEPVKHNHEFLAHVTFADGSRATWRIPEYDRFIGALRAGRWSKWMEVIRNDAYGAVVFKSTALYVARSLAKDGRRPVKVTFTRREQALPPFGTDQRQPWRSETYYELELGPDTLE